MQKTKKASLLMTTINQLNLKDKFTYLISISAIVIFSLSSIGFWRYSQFANHKTLIQTSSQKLLSELEGNFANSQLMGDIEADLTTFMQTGHPAAMVELTNKTQRLAGQLPDEAKESLLQFLNKIGKLEIRMESLRKNNDTALSAGTAIHKKLEDTKICASNKVCMEEFQHAGEIFRTVQPLYITGILQTQTKEIQETRTEISQYLAELDGHLQKTIPSLPTAQSLSLTNLQELFYDFDDAITTVAAIRQRVIDSEHEVLSHSKTIKNLLAGASIAQSQKAVDLAEQGLKLATSYVFLMFASLGVMTVLFLVLSSFMSRSIIAPLVVLVDLLKKFSYLLATVRRQAVAGGDEFKIIHSQIIKRKDEIGDVGRATKELMDHIQGISEFRRKIEDDTTTQEVYSRLATIFTAHLHLPSFIIYERSADNAMPIVYSEPSDITEFLPEFATSDMCRAKRTGAVVSSFNDPEICKICPINDMLNHYCVPMLVGGHVIGVIQFLLPIATNADQKKKMDTALNEARNYIEEALPVLQAKRFATKLEEMATKDQLTGLYNRRYLEISLQQIVAGIKRRKSRMGVLMCDMDFFKEVNDNHGHDAGDIVLSDLAAILNKNVRSSDLVIRYGGEEFLILLNDIEDGTASLVADKLRSAVESYRFQIPGAEIQKTLSIGVAEYPDPTISKGIWQIIKQADVALYNAKNGGRNQVVTFAKEMWEEQSY
jgi:diguanylate cyclase (GGDEF)-like protein